MTRRNFTNKKNGLLWFLNGDFAYLSTGFMKLLDNYERSTGVAERVTAEEVTENNSFLDAVLETAVMKVWIHPLITQVLSFTT